MREEIRHAIRQAVAWVVQAGSVAKSSADGHGDELAGRSEPDEPSYQEAVRRLWPFGIRSRPPAGVECVIVRSSGAPGVMLGAESAKYGPSDLEDGETAIYCAAADCLILLDKDGKLRIHAKAGQNIALDVTGGGDIVLNGGTLNVARYTDPVNRFSAMATWMAAVETATGVPPLVGAQIGYVASGADHVKG